MTSFHHRRKRPPGPQVPCIQRIGRASRRGPRRAASASTRTTRTPWDVGRVSTSPGRRRACGLSVGCRLMRTLPSATQPAQAARAFMKRAHHSHLSRRCQVRSSASGRRSRIALKAAGWRGRRTDRRARRGQAAAAAPGRPPARLGRQHGRGRGSEHLRRQPRRWAPAARPGRAARPAASPRGPTGAAPARRHGRRAAAGGEGQFGRDPLRDVEPQQHRPRLDPAHRLGKARWPGARRRQRDQARRWQRRGGVARRRRPTAAPAAPSPAASAGRGEQGEPPGPHAERLQRRPLGPPAAPRRATPRRRPPAPDAARRAAPGRLGRQARQQRRKLARDAARPKRCSRTRTRSRCGAVEVLADQHLDLRAQQAGAGPQPGDRRALPSDR